jgi:hypothetical protein
VPGFPIRTPWDHSSVDSSPRPIAASHVLHRLLVPRHPPFALDNLTTKMLASTVQFSTNDQPTTPTHTPHPNHDQPQSTTTGRYVYKAVPGEKTTPHCSGATFATWNNPGLFSQDSTGCSSSSTSRTDHVVFHQVDPPPKRWPVYCDRRPLPVYELRQCLRHMSAPTRQTRIAGS